MYKGAKGEKYCWHVKSGGRAGAQGFTDDELDDILERLNDYDPEDDDGARSEDGVDVRNILGLICSDARPYKGAKMAGQIQELGWKTSWAKSDDGMSACFEFVHVSTVRANRTRAKGN